jgi:hypothetical protein
MEKVSLEARLVAAQLAMQPVQKDGTNRHSRYDYTTSGGMIKACRRALNDNGLAFKRTKAKVNMMAGIAGPILILESKYRLICDGYEDFDKSKIMMASYEYEQDFPIVEGKGRPIDKAHAIALTTSLSYQLRDLLCVVRGDKEEDTMDTRDDSDYAPVRYIAPQEPKIADLRQWPEIIEKYRPVLEHHGVSEAGLALMTVPQFEEFRLKVGM